MESNVERLRDEFESSSEWGLRRQFLAKNEKELSTERLVCLSRCFVNMVVYGCRYPSSVMQELNARSHGIVHSVEEEHLERTKQKIGIPFVKATDADNWKEVNQNSQKESGEELGPNCLDKTPTGGFWVRGETLGKPETNLETSSEKKLKLETKPSCSYPEYSEFSNEAKPITSFQNYFSYWEKETDEHLKIVRKFVLEILKLPGSIINAKAKLHAGASKLRANLEFYMESPEETFNLNKEFTCTIFLNDFLILGMGSATSIKESKTVAGELALQTMFMPVLEIRRSEKGNILMGSLGGSSSTVSGGIFKSVNPRGNFKSTNRFNPPPVNRFNFSNQPGRRRTQFMNNRKRKIDQSYDYRVADGTEHYEYEEEEDFDDEEEYNEFDEYDLDSEYQQSYKGAYNYNVSSGSGNTVETDKPIEEFLIIVSNTDQSPGSILNSSADINHVNLEFEYTPNGSKYDCTLWLGDKIIGEAEEMNRTDGKREASEKGLDYLKTICWTISFKQAVDSNTTTSKEEMLKDLGIDSDAIGSSNVGNRLLRKMGWTGGGVGKHGTGIAVPVCVTTTINREGLGLDTYKGITDSFRKKVQEMIKTYAKSTKQEDFVFTSDFSSEERAVIHAEAKKFGLKSKSRGKGEDRYLTISRRRTANQLFEHVKSCGGETEKYQLIPPSGSND